MKGKILICLAFLVVISCETSFDIPREAGIEQKSSEFASQAEVMQDLGKKKSVKDNKYIAMFGVLKKDIKKMSLSQASSLLKSIRVFPYLSKEVEVGQEILGFFNYLKNKEKIDFPTKDEIDFYEKAWANQDGIDTNIPEVQWIAYALSCSYIFEIDKVDGKEEIFLRVVNVQDGQILFDQDLQIEKPAENNFALFANIEDTALSHNDITKQLADSVIDVIVNDLALGNYFELNFYFEDDKVEKKLDNFFKKEVLTYNKKMTKNEKVVYTIRESGTNLDIDRFLSNLSNTDFVLSLTYIDRNSLYYFCWSQ